MERLKQVEYNIMQSIQQNSDSSLEEDDMELIKQIGGSLKTKKTKDAKTSAKTGAKASTKENSKQPNEIITLSQFCRICQYSFTNYEIFQQYKKENGISEDKEEQKTKNTGYRQKRSKTHDKEPEDTNKTEYKLVYMKKVLIYANSYDNMDSFVKDVQQQKINGLSQGAVNLVHFCQNEDYQKLVQKQHDKLMQVSRRLQSIKEYTELHKKLNQLCGGNLHIAGSLKRNDIYISDLDCILECDDSQQQEYFLQIEQFFIKNIDKLKIQSVIKQQEQINGQYKSYFSKQLSDEKGDNQIDIKKYDGYMRIIIRKEKFYLNIDIWQCNSKKIVNYLYFYTGSKFFITAMAQLYKQQGMKLSRDGIYADTNEGTVPKPQKNEEEIFKTLKLKPLPVEMR